MNLTCFRVHAFTQDPFGGNPACVIPLTTWPDDRWMLQMAKEMAVAETAYIGPSDNSEDEVDFHLRWFTPDLEMDLCGHATLASAHVVLRHLTPDATTVRFSSASGPLTVREQADGRLEMDLPSRPPAPAKLPEAIANALNHAPIEVLKSRDYVLVYPDQKTVDDICIDRAEFDQINLGHGGVIVTAPGNEVDFVSRFFTPQATILEDPVTGSAHCSLVPYWSTRTGATEFKGEQRSARRGQLQCTLSGDRVLVRGHALTFSAAQLSSALFTKATD
jgi:PhzF family phenazine biosynthesis protein